MTIVAQPRGIELPLSWPQERVYSQYATDPSGPGHHLTMLQHLRGELDVDRLRSAFAAVVDRHEVLRSAFVNGHQRVHRPEPFSLPLDEVDSVDAVIADETTRRFDLGGGVLLRARLARRAREDHLLVINAHHIAADQRSLELVWAEIKALYEGAPLAPLAIQYADYAAWQRTWLPALPDAHTAHWRQRLGQFSPPFQSPPTNDRAERMEVALGASLNHAVDELARRSKTSSFVVLLAAFRAALRTSVGADVAVGVVFANRVLKETVGLVGFFQNVLPLAIPPRSEASFADLVLYETRGTREAFARQDVPAEAIVCALGLDRSSSRNPLVHVLFTQSTYPEAEVFGGLVSEPVDHVAREIVFPLEVVLRPDRIALLYKDCFTKDFIAQVADRYVTMLGSAT